ncbi:MULTISPECIES: carotenoid biosynthesis protein [Massilia]|uniref:Carotenoid biosynthesis protein n=1 Tax=Massilia haematophila TaxID=457923 RepID=A0ABV7PKQ3_9BURK|nr:carotenoid biosynthesis protein [Massilia sp.]HBZ05617.1 carotenoid biosynthesis protein [Massilia sp.]
MKSLQRHLPRITFILLALSLAALATRGLEDTTRMLIVGSLAMFACAWSSAIHLLGGRAALHFVLIAVTLGWGAEELGSQYGWFFGDYTYTDVLGPTVGSVPFVIPLMWFVLTYIAYVLANLMVWQTPVDGATPLGQTLTQSFLAAMIVTAYDLGADPYLVFKLKAWVMHKPDGWWFGETLQGFVGWMFVSFTIVFLFRLSLRRRPPVAAATVSRIHTLVPLAIYGGNMVFQACLGVPVETRTIALFAMGIPLLTALFGWSRWQMPALAAVPAVPAVPATPAAATRLTVVAREA